MYPEFTTLTKDENGHKKGDPVIVMDARLAQKLNDFIGRIEDCEDGTKFNAEHPDKKRARATLGRSICSGESVAINSGKGGPFSDIAMIKHNQMSIMIKDTAKKAKEAFFVIKDFVIAYGPMLAIPEEVIEQVAIYVAAVVINAVVDGIAVEAQTLLAVDVWVAVADPSQTELPTTTSKSGCPDPTKKPVSMAS